MSRPSPQRPDGPQDRAGGYYAKRPEKAHRRARTALGRFGRVRTAPPAPVTVEARAPHFFPFPKPARPMRRGRWLDRVTGRMRRSLWRTGLPSGRIVTRAAERRAVTRNIDENAQLGIVRGGTEIGQVPDRPKYRPPGGGLG